MNGVLDFGFSSGTTLPLTMIDWSEASVFGNPTGIPIVTTATSSASQVIAAVADYPAAAALVSGTIA